jgi:hypothetical protein
MYASVYREDFKTVKQNKRLFAFKLFSFVFAPILHIQPILKFLPNKMGEWGRGKKYII